ncbi:MAG: pseudouridine synthase [Chitinophagaceae bacterium]
MTARNDNRIHYFPAEQISDIAIPERFTFPFYYEPHPLALIAAGALQQYLENEAALDHNFGLEGDPQGAVIGKMFGVLVVQDKEGKPGYLWACSGKLAGTNDHARFVPPVFDMLVEEGFFLKEQEFIIAINFRIRELESDPLYLQLQAAFKECSSRFAEDLSRMRQEMKRNKKHRDELRGALSLQSDAETRLKLESELVNESLRDKRQLRDIVSRQDSELAELQSRLDVYTAKIDALKQERRERSASLQEQLFTQYVFLDKDGREKSLRDIFSATAFGKPPAAAGECATPKLLQYAFRNGYRPIAMAEFWWGASPKSEIRKHGQFYPACTGKCKPILAHMLSGIPLEENPFLHATSAERGLSVVYDDAHFVVIHKPHGLRSVPGVNIADSVYTRLKQLWNGAEPLMVHRLDMDTSGLLVVARTPAAHKHIQKQFLRRTIRKRYTALLSKPLEADEGIIELPLCADPFNRPRQLVDFEKGKKSITRWCVTERSGQFTKVSFWPLTGRTHQLRMHAAHELGLNAPIVGDDLYGTPAERMFLHAAELELVHPVTRQRMLFRIADDFPRPDSLL